MADAAWKAALRPASFRGVPFRIDVTTITSGRRGQTFEFPKRDVPEDEDMGRRAYRLVFTGWVIGDDCLEQADAVEAACRAEGPARLVHPTRGAIRARCDLFTRSERRIEGGMVSFDMAFVEAPNASATGQAGEPTQANVQGKADEAGAAAVASAGDSSNNGEWY